MKFKKIISVTTAVFMLISQAVSAKEESVEYDYFKKLMTYASQLYIEEGITTEELIDTAIKKALEDNPEFVTELLKAGFASLDEYSEYYTAEEFINYVNGINHTFYGIGVVIRKNGDYIEITNCLEDGSAFAAGMKTGDKIVSVDGIDAVGKTLTDVQNLVIGELNTTVSITVLRGEEEKSFTMERKPVSSQTVSYSVLKGNIGYISVLNFAEKTDTEFEEALGAMNEAGVENIILDLRDNPGGYLTSSVNIAKMIVPEGIIVQTMYRREEQNETFYSTLKNPKYKFAVLVNENTASAAEVLAAAMQDSGIGTLIGKTTYGKAVIQEMFRLSDGGFKLTTGHYLTRNGHEINKIGIEPDEYVVNTKERVDMSKYTSFDYKIKWRVGDESDSIKAAKERLYGLGFYRGEINCIFDTELAAAVTAFQAAMDLFPYGVLDISTQVRIENEFYHTEQIVDRQFEKAYTMLGGNFENLEE